MKGFTFGFVVLIVFAGLLMYQLGKWSKRLQTESDRNALVVEQLNGELAECREKKFLMDCDDPCDSLRVSRDNAECKASQWKDVVENCVHEKAKVERR